MVADFLEANPNDCGSCRASSQAYDVVKAVHLQASSAIDTSYKPYIMLERRNFTAQVSGHVKGYTTLNATSRSSAYANEPPALLIS